MDDFGLYHYVQGPVRSAATRVSAGARYRVGSAGLLQHQVRNADIRKRNIVHHNLCGVAEFSIEHHCTGKRDQSSRER